MTTTSNNSNETQRKDLLRRSSTRKDLLMVGTTFTVEKKRERAKFWYFPGSLNCQKAHACLRFSSFDETKIDYELMAYPEDNQKLDYCRLNPNMSIPALEIDDKIITDSLEIQKYLFENYPSKGDAAIKIKEETSPDSTQKMQSMIDAVLKWDEYLFSYRRMPKFIGKAIHNIRFVTLSDVVWSIENSDDTIKWDETLRDGQTLRQAYVKKIAQVRGLDETGCEEESSELHKNIEANSKLLENIFELASQMIDDSKGPLLMGGTELTSADAYLFVVVARSNLDKELQTSLFDKYPNTRNWWETFQSLDESKVLLQDNGLTTLWEMIKTGKPIKFLGYALGLYVPKPLPEDFEKEVQEEWNKMQDKYYIK